MKPQFGNDLNLGFLPGGGRTLQFPRTMRDKHLYVCGGTGTGKSKFLEHLIRQDIVAWRNSKCGMLVLDPHGSLYDSLLQWMAWAKIDRPVVPIDLRQDDWIVSYNVLRQRSVADPQVLIDSITQAIAHVWGQGGIEQTPRFARWVGNVLNPLYEKGLTLVEAEHLIDIVGSHLRRMITYDLKSKSVRQDWALAESLNERDFESQIGSTVNRLLPFLKNKIMRATFGIPEASLDLGKALEQGSIILVNLATERAKISEENANLFATLLLTDLWTAAKERGKPRDGKSVKPFYVYVDEFQEFITPTIAKSLDQARGFGLHLTLANQFPGQILNSGPHGKQVYGSIMENASSKVVFRLTDDENLLPMAKWLFRGELNPDAIKHELYSTRVMEYREELKTVRSESTSSGIGGGSSRGRAGGAGSGGTENYQGPRKTGRPKSLSESQSAFASESESHSDSWSEGWSDSVSYVPTLVPVLGKELSHVQFQSIDEQLFRSMAVLFDQQERFNVTRLVGMKAPVALRTPTVTAAPGSEKRTKKFLSNRYSKIPFALKGSEAQARLDQRTDALYARLEKEYSLEPANVKRRLR